MRMPIVPVSLLFLSLGGCTDEAAAPTEPSPAALFSCLFGTPRGMEVGEVALFAGEAAQTLCLGGGDEGAEYLYVPFYAADVGVARLRLELSGGGFRSPVEPAGPAAARLAADTMLPNERWHVDLRRREIEELTPLFPRARAARPPGGAAGALRAAAPLRVGELISLNTTTDCSALDREVGRVEAITRTAIVVADTSNPVGGFTENDWRFFGEAFDTLVAPVNTRNFGEPTDIDENDRVIIFFTEAVNELTPPGSGSFVGGFFWGGDLFPNEACPGSNTAEMFYMLVPDPARAAAGERVFEPSFVKRITVGTLGHEFQHLINAGHRIYLNEAESFEEVWLNEGLSHIAEELLFYHVTGLEPRENIDLETILETPHRRLSFAAYQESNFGRFLQYLERPDTVSLFGIDDLPTRGASWAFLRYAADQEDGPDAPLFQRLVDGVEAGVPNLENALPDFDALDLIQAWTVSVYTDDLPIPVAPIYRQPSWNFRSIMPAFAGAPGGGYPLDVLVPAPGETRVITLQGGGAAFVRFGVEPSGRAVLRTGVGGLAPPEALRLSLVRIR